MAHTIGTVEAAPGPPHLPTFDAFLAWADEDTHAEWVDGRDLGVIP